MRGEVLAQHTVECDENPTSRVEFDVALLHGGVYRCVVTAVNSVGLVACAEAAKRLQVPGPCVMQVFNYTYTYRMPLRLHLEQNLHIHLQPAPNSCTYTYTYTYRPTPGSNPKRSDPLNYTVGRYTCRCRTTTAS